MSVTTDSKIEYLHVVDLAIDFVGENIEAVYPLLANMDPKTQEYQLLNRLWTDWCEYLNN